MRRLDPVVLLLALVAVLVGTIVGLRGHTNDVDEVLFRTTLRQMQAGEDYYTAFERAIEDKAGVGPTQVRSVRTPVLSELLALAPEGAWRWMATVPALALCLAAAALAGPDLLTQRVASALTGVWMVVSLPLLYLHAELWGAALVVWGALLVRRDHDVGAAVVCLLATALRELFGISLLVGLVLGRDRRPWVAALVAAAAGAAVHARWATAILDPDGFDPPLGAYDAYTRFVAPGESVGAQVLGVLLLLAAVAGFALRRSDRGARFAALVAVPLVAATALAGRAYWTLTWCGLTSAAGAVAIVAAWRRIGGHWPVRSRTTAPYPRH